MDTPGCSNAARPVRIDTPGVLQCCTAGAQGHTGGVAMLHGRCAWTHRGCCNAARAVRMDTPRVSQCCMAVAQGHTRGVALQHGLCAWGAKHGCPGMVMLRAAPGVAARGSPSGTGGRVL